MHMRTIPLNRFELYNGNFMYDPASPNNYRDIKIARWKRMRDEEQKNDIARALAEAADAGPSPFDFQDIGPLPSPGSSLTDTNEGGEVMPLHLSAEELHQRRVRQSAVLGIGTAVRMERDEFEAAHKAKVAEGLDRKGHIRQKLGKLMEVATAMRGASGGGGTVPAEAPHPSIGVGSAPLSFQRADLAAGGYVVKENCNAQEKRKMLQGKPSSTILIRFIDGGPPVELFDTDDDNSGSANSNTISSGIARKTFLEGVQDQCGRWGVVRSVRHAVLCEEERATLRARLKEREVANVDAHLAREMVRVFVRFDTVASAFKAIESLQQQCSHWSVCFFPTQLFDAGKLGPVEAEPLCHP